MAMPFAVMLVLLPITVVAYILLRLYDRISGNRKNYVDRQLVKRRSVHLLISLVIGMVVLVYFIYKWSLTGAGIYT